MPFQPSRALPIWATRQRGIACSTGRLATDRALIEPPSPHGDEADQREGYRDKPQVEPGPIAVEIFRPAEKLDHQPDADGKPQSHANEIVWRVVGRPDGLVLGQADAQHY